MNGTTTEFFLNGSQILAQKTGDSVMRFFYDSTGKRVGFANGTMLFYYLYNVQGDVIAIVRAATGQVVAKYSYDAWGKCTVTNAAGYAVGDKNPFRYRGYYYDTETGLYYLNSRYYNSEFGRFISADGLIDNRGATSQNLFAYCYNNPVNYSDADGHLPFCVITALAGAIAGAIIGGVRAAKSGNSVWTGALKGAAIGGVIGLGVGMAAGVVLAGSATASTGAVVAGAGTLASTISTGGLGAGASYIANNVSRAVGGAAPVAEKVSTALQPYYPPNNGFSGNLQRVTLDAGTMLQRTGHLYGSYVAPAGTPFQMLSLPYDKIGQATTILQVQQPLQVSAGQVAPWFGQIGGGTQYLLDSPVMQLITTGVIKIMGE